jgi:hypothetical protein
MQIDDDSFDNYSEANKRNNNEYAKLQLSTTVEEKMPTSRSRNGTDNNLLPVSKANTVGFKQTVKLSMSDAFINTHKATKLDLDLAFFEMPDIDKALKNKYEINKPLNSEYIMNLIENFQEMDESDWDLFFEDDKSRT